MDQYKQLLEEQHRQFEGELKQLREFKVRCIPLSLCMRFGSLLQFDDSSPQRMAQYRLSATF